MEPPDLEWVKVKGNLSHDLLNILLTNIISTQNLIKNSYSRNKLEEKLCGWKEVKKDSIWLIDNFFLYQTPIAFLEHPPLISANLFQKLILKTALHNLYKNKYEKSLSELSELIHKIDSIYEDIINKLKIISTDKIPNMNILLRNIIKFYDNIIELSEIIKNLPKEITL